MSTPLLISTCNADIMGITLGKTTLSDLEQTDGSYSRCFDCGPNQKYWDCNYDNNTYSTKYFSSVSALTENYYPTVEIENDTGLVIRVLISFKKHDANVDNCGNKGSSFTMNEFLSAKIFNVPQQNFKQISNDKCLKIYSATDNLSNYIEVDTNGNNQLTSIYYSLSEPVIQKRMKNSKINTLKELGSFK